MRNDYKLFFGCFYFWIIGFLCGITKHGYLSNSDRNLYGAIGVAMIVVLLAVCLVVSIKIQEEKNKNKEKDK